MRERLVVSRPLKDLLPEVEVIHVNGFTTWITNQLDLENIALVRRCVTTHWDVSRGPIVGGQWDIDRLLCCRTG